MNQGWSYTDKVDRHYAGGTLLDFYSRNYSHSSIDVWRERIEKGQIQVEGEQATPDHILAVGQKLVYHRPPWAEPLVPLDFKVLYEDEDLWLIHKPSGLQVLPGGDFLEHTLLYQLHQKFPQENPTPLHRLGRGTSGIMLIARSHLARRHLSQQWRDRRINKKYWALVGDWSWGRNVEINQPIDPVAYEPLGYLYAATPSGKTAQSFVRVLARHQRRTLLEVTIPTGRPHQIRIHLAAAGYPLLGDRLYGPGGLPLGQGLPSDEGYCLQAHHIGFEHPRFHHWFTFTLPAPHWFPAGVDIS